MRQQAIKVTKEELEERLIDFFKKFSCERCGEELKMTKSNVCVNCRAELNYQRVKSYQMAKWLKK